MNINKIIKCIILSCNISNVILLSTSKFMCKLIKNCNSRLKYLSHNLWKTDGGIKKLAVSFFKVFFCHKHWNTGRKIIWCSQFFKSFFAKEKRKKSGFCHLIFIKGCFFCNNFSVQKRMALSAKVRMSANRLLYLLCCFQTYNMALGIRVIWANQLW